MVLKEFDIGGNSAIVTGAARGLGKAIALTLAEAGADVAVADFREEVEETAREIRELGRKGIAVRTDVREAEQVEHMVQAALAEFGKVDIMVANAGVEWVKPLLLVDGKPPVRMRVDVNLESGLDEEDWNRTLDEAHEAALYRITFIHSPATRYGRLGSSAGARIARRLPRIRGRELYYRACPRCRWRRIAVTERRSGPAHSP